MKFALLEFDPAHNQINDDKKLSSGLSVSVRIENTLWVANDETISLERLSLINEDDQGNYFYGKHEQFLLSNFIELPVPPTFSDTGKIKFKEADIEGLDYKDGYLWLVGSHSAKRKKSESGHAETNEERLTKLSDVKSDGNRFVLARIPLEKQDETFVPKDKVEQNRGIRVAAQLKDGIIANEIINLQNDEHLKKFFDIPGKDNGFDIEGLAVAGKKIFIGLRGPVLRGWAVILELLLDDEVDHSSSVLLLKGYKKHVLPLDGLGIRDLCIHESDLLILAGPTMELDGPVTIYRWIGGVNQGNDSVIFNKDILKKVMDLPFGKGVDHAEGMTLFSSTGDRQSDLILVVYDSASQDRQPAGTTSLKADVFPLFG
ncbi:DUF3616 domain-containing protein [Dyadobacter psychrophilus]|uniref:DUF3616 domain-containing protein n=1 Tax=Dyadobacter psychrophilus TaxID=651661 RepID=A0A1T5D9F0_9BACT|nr:DUF3616 domain-containing protein [Dyadobacter psychrophilus]SKB68382.1 Protein of unknown function [Dyadobacter psychrophilus]